MGTPSATLLLVPLYKEGQCDDRVGIEIVACVYGNSLRDFVARPSGKRDSYNGRVGVGKFRRLIKGL